MIVFNPKNRYDIHECLNHPFFDTDRQYINLLRDKGQANSELSGFNGKTDDNGRFYVEDKDILAIYYTEIGGASSIQL